jgi:DNA (cytosine-5)-methyltransferase 1
VANDEIVSLFCGAGGLDLGFEQAKYTVGAAFDLRQFSIDSYNLNRRGTRGHVADVNKLTIQDIDELVGKKLAPVGLIGGPPCQSFSRATHSSDDDYRHDLPLEFARILRAYNKRSAVSFFAFENVPGLLKERHKKRLQRILSAFRGAGFNVTSHILNASSFGVPQNRSRLILVGLNRTIYPEATWEPPVATSGVRSVASAIAGLPEPTFWSRDVNRSEIRPHENHWCMTPKSVKFRTKGALKPGTALGRSFRMLEWDKPSPTIAYGHREVHVHPGGHRRLSVYEALLLQGFPEKYRLSGSLSDQITQVSEAVPPPLAFAIAKSIRHSLSAKRSNKKAA